MKRALFSHSALFIFCSGAFIASLEHVDNGVINSMLHMVYNVKQPLFTCRCCVFFPFFLIFPPCQKRSRVILGPSFAAFLRALSEPPLVHFILRTVSNKINRSVCWETPASGWGKIRKEETCSNKRWKTRREEKKQKE